MIAFRVSPPAPLRWAAIVPAALLAAVAAQVVLMALAGLALSSFYVSGPDWVIWAVKSVASVFMGAAFAGAAAWTAPANRRGIAIVAVTVVVVWAGLLATGGPAVWGLTMGGGGVLGALGASVLIWRVSGPGGSFTE